MGGSLIKLVKIKTLKGEYDKVAELKLKSIERMWKKAERLQN